MRTDCLEMALTNNERFGVFGGMAPKERDRLRRRRGHVPERANKGLSEAEVVRLRELFARVFEETDRPMVACKAVAEEAGMTEGAAHRLVCGMTYVEFGGPLHQPRPMKKGRAA